MKKSIMEKWVAALRSGDYRQGQGQLRKSGNFCCLGVLCNIHAQTYPKIAAMEKSKTVYLGEAEVLPEQVANWAGISYPDGEFVAKNGDIHSLASLNDNGSNFKELAEIIEKNYRKL